MKIWNLRVQKNLNIEKITFKLIQIKFLNQYQSKKLFEYIYGRIFTKYHHGTWIIFIIKE